MSHNLRAKLLCVLSIVAGAMFAAGEAAVADAGAPRRVLRHVVLLKFKDSVPPDKVKQLEDGFRALPGKIDTIIDFEWGKDVSVEGLSQGFTHCFRVTFNDPRGRAAYLPHAAHKEFVTAIRPNLEKVLVVDYMTKLSDKAARQQADPRRLLRHLVLFKYDEMADVRAVEGIKTAFQALPGQVEAIYDFECGDEVSVEGLAQGFQHCFCVTFEDEKARSTYLPHPKHKEFGSVLKPHLDKVMVFDYYTSK
jgi:hypothetical protein